MPDLYTILRNFTEDDVALMLHRANIRLPITTAAEALELVQRAVDVATGEDDAAEIADEFRMDAEIKRHRI